MKKYVKLFEDFVDSSDLEYTKLITDPVEVREYLNQDDSIIKGTYKINANGVVDVEGSVNLSAMDLYKVPIQFGRVSTNLYLNNNFLTTLEGLESLTYVGGLFDCSANFLTRLDHIKNLKHVGRYVKNSYNLLCMNEPFEIYYDNPGYIRTDMEDIAEEFKNNLRYISEDFWKLIAESLKPDVIEMCYKYDITQMTDFLSDNVKTIAGAAMKGNHKLK